MERRTALAATLSGALLAATANTAAEAAQADQAKVNRKLLQDFIDALTAHDIQKFKALYVADGYVQHQTLRTNAAALAGREAVVTYFSKRIEAFPDLVVTSDISLTHLVFVEGPFGVGHDMSGRLISDSDPTQLELPGSKGPWFSTTVRITPTRPRSGPSATSSAAFTRAGSTSRAARSRPASDEMERRRR